MRWAGQRGRGFSAAELATARSLRVGNLIEVDCSDGDGKPQGHALLVVTSRPRDGGRGPSLRALGGAFSDGYYDWWATATFGPSGDPGTKDIMVHFCPVHPPRSRCKEIDAVETMHVTQYRILPPDEVAGLAWISPEQRVVVETVLSQVVDPPVPPSAGAGPAAGGSVTGEEPVAVDEPGPSALPAGLDGVAEALGVPLLYPAREDR